VMKILLRCWNFISVLETISQSHPSYFLGVAAPMNE
jgi:hypothetical protein